MIDAGADESSEGTGGITPLQLAQDQGHLDVVRLLQDAWGEVAKLDEFLAGTDVNLLLDGFTLLHRAADGGNLPLCRSLIAAGADVDLVAASGDTALLFAAAKGHAGACRILIAAGATLNLAKPDGTAPLHFAAGNGHVETCRVLTAAGADLGLTDTDGATAMHKAAESGQVGACRALVAAGADVHAMDDESRTPLDVAKWSCDLITYASLRTILTDPGADVSPDGWTPLHTAAISGTAEACRALVASGVDVNAKDVDGFTALHRAASEGRAALCSALLSVGADANAENNDRFMPLHGACMTGCAEASLVLIAAGAAVNARGGTNLRWTPLHNAASGGPLEICQALIRAGADVTAEDHGGFTPLHMAAANGAKEICQSLIAAGARVNAAGGFRGTPLHDAVANGHVEVSRVLLAAGADLTATDSSGKTALDQAGNNRDLIALLQWRDACTVPSTGKLPPSLGAIGANAGDQVNASSAVVDTPKRTGDAEKVVANPKIVQYVPALAVLVVLVLGAWWLTASRSRPDTPASVPGTSASTSTGVAATAAELTRRSQTGLFER